VFVSVGTGGTISGSAKKLKELNPNIKIVGIDPFGSILAQPESLNESDVCTYHVEGIGYDFIPGALTREYVDSWYKTSDAPSFEMARRMIAEEGLLCGGSCGSTVYGAIEWLKQNGLDKNKDLRCVSILSDGIRNYLTKFVSDEWMVAHGFLGTEVLLQKEHPLFGKTIADLELSPIPHYDDRFTVNDALDALDAGHVAVPIIENGKIKGIVTRDSLLKSVVKKGLGN
jgi:cystathionine beta-synthase